MKYVRNTYSSDIQINLKDENGQKYKSIVFARYAVDRLTGNVASDGFTEVDDEDYKYLEKSNAFKLMLKNGNLIVQDDAPLKAGSFEQILEAKQRIKELEALNAELTEKLKTAEAEIAKLKGEGASDTGSVDSQDDELSKLSYDELKAKATELGIEFKANIKKADLIALVQEKAGR